MQQYRLNYVLLIGLIVGTMLTSGVVYAVWKAQIERRADALLIEAQKAKAEGDLVNAVKFYRLYVSIHPMDEEQRVAYSNSYADLTNEPGAQMEVLKDSLRAMEETLREFPNQIALRRRLAEQYGKVGLFQDAISHLEMISSDQEAQAMRAKFLFAAGRVPEAITLSYKLIGYDPNSGKFEKGTAPGDTGVYLNLAAALRAKEDKPELAEEVIDQMVTANPNSVTAYLARGQYFNAYGEPTRARTNIEKAYQLGPKDVNALLAMAEVSAQEKQFEKAREYLTIAKKLHPEELRVYQSEASVYAAEKDIKGAMTAIDEGLKAVESSKNGFLLVFKADLQLSSRDMKGAKETIAEMERVHLNPGWIDWYKARILAFEEKWFTASEALMRLRPWATNVMIGNVSGELNNLLGLCHERLGRLELALECYKLVLAANSKDERAEAGRARVEAALLPTSGQPATNPLAEIIDAMSKKPKNEQDWDSIDKRIDEYAVEQKLEKVDILLFKINVLIYRKEFAKARDLVREALMLDSKALQVGLAAIRLTLLDPAQGPAKAIDMVDQLTKNPKFGDQPLLRLAKADILIEQNREDAPKIKLDLAGVLAGLDNWTVQQKSLLWTNMASRYLGLGMREEARQCLTLVADNQSDDLPTRMSLFRLALEEQSDEAMQAAEKRILEVVKSTDSPDWLYADAQRRLSLVRRGRAQSDTLPEIRTQVEQALEGRPEWHELYVLAAEVELVAGNLPAALKHLEASKSRGRRSPQAIAIHTKLLAADGQISAAAEMLDTLPEANRLPLLGTLYFELLFRTNKVDDAIKAARAQTEATPNNAQSHFVYGQLLARASEQAGISADERKAKLQQAIAAVQKSLELAPDFGNGWIELVRYSFIANDTEKKQKALRDAQLALSSDNLQLTMAKCYEAVGQWFDAEPMYRAVYEANPEEIGRIQQLAAFYMGPGYQQPDLADKVAPLINKVLRAGADGKIPPNDPNLTWARRNGARLLAATGEYQQQLDAEKLLSSNSQGGLLALEDRVEMASILAPRPDPVSRRKAIGLYEEIEKSQPLNESQAMSLGGLYYLVGDWPKARTQMRETIARYTTSVLAREAYIRMLLDRGDRSALQEATDELGKLTALAPPSMRTLALMVRWAPKVGRDGPIRSQLVQQQLNVPNRNDPAKMTEEQAQQLAYYANLLVDLKDFVTAEEIFRLLSVRGAERVYALAYFLGSHRDVEQSFDLLDTTFDTARASDIVNIAINVLRKRRDEVGNRYDARVQSWLDRGFAANPGAVPLQLVQAEFFDLQQKYDEAIAIYRKLLDDPNESGVRRALVLNNLSYLISLSDGEIARSDVDALELVNQAADILGPTADILDTRAIVLIARKKYREAIEDLKLSVTDNPTASKYFHKATAHMLAGDNRDALEAWQKAEDLGLTRDEVNRMELNRYDQIKSRIDKLRAGTSAVPRVESKALTSGKLP